MDLPVRPPLAPMLARLARELPRDGPYVFEPKWDGFRALAFRDHDEVDLRSRNDRAFARYFPEVVGALRALDEARVVLDGELLVADGGFSALLARLHPARSRVELLARTTPATYAVFDLLACAGHDLRARPFAERRAALERLLSPAPPQLKLTPATDERGVAAGWLAHVPASAVDGVMAKDPALPYEPGRRTMLKIKPERTVDCVVAGFRLFADEPVVSSLLLGVYDDAGALHHIGVVTSFPRAARAQLLAELDALVAPLTGHPWEHGFGLEGGALSRLKGTAGRWTPEMTMDWVPIRPVLVCEVAYDHLEGTKFRHPARFRRWRPDRDPRSCTLDQLRAPAA